MKALITSCGRPDLLKRTIESLMLNQKYPLEVTIHEDAKEAGYNQSEILTKYKAAGFSAHVINTGEVGQHASIEKFLKITNDKYYLHLEDDWEFENKFDWITASIAIMQKDPSIVKVLCRNNSPHPCEHDKALNNKIKYGYLQPWKGEDNIVWSGFSFNPGVTNAKILRQFIPFPKWEQLLAERIYRNGYKVVEMIPSIYEHIGDGRSTVGQDTAKTAE